MQAGPQPTTAADGSVLPSVETGIRHGRSAVAAVPATAVWTAMGLVLWVLFPMTGAVLLPMCCIAPVGWYWAQRRRFTWYRVSALTLALVLAASYLLVNASWSLSVGTAARTVVLLFLLAGTLHVVLNTLPDLEEPPLRAMAVGALVGLGVAGSILCVEIFSDQSLRRFLMHLIPALQPSPNHIEMAAGHLARLAAYLPNASISVLTLMFWPAALLVDRLGTGLGTARQLRRLAPIAAIVVATTVFASEHGTSQVAFVGAGVAFTLARLRPKLVMPVVIAGWTAAILLVAPVVSLLYSTGVQRAAWLPESARERVVIWRYTAEQIPQAPILGAGIGTARALYEAREANAPVAPGTHFRLTTSLHSHNAYLQVWYEAGAVGAAIVLLLGWVILWALRKYPSSVQPYLLATFVACALLVATAYSIWAPWYMAALAMAAVFASLGAALPEPRADRTPTVR